MHDAYSGVKSSVVVKTPKNGVGPFFFYKYLLITGPCARNEPLTLEMGQPEKPTPSGFRARIMIKGWDEMSSNL